MRRYLQRLEQFAAVCCLLFVASGSLTASAATNNISSAVAQSYTAGSSLQTGMIVEPQAGKSQTVIPLRSSDIRRMLGVAVSASNATIVITPATSSQQQVLVATSGHYSVLVSNQNGPIKVGDYITISSVDGIGMAAGSDQPEVIGRADTNFSGVGNTLGTVQLKNQKGQSSTVTLGIISVDVNVTPNPLYKNSLVLIPGFANQFVTSVTGKQVNPIRLYLATLLLAVTVFIVASIIIGSVRGSLVAIGRNPLSKQAITRSLLLTVVMGLLIFAAGVFAVYLLLKL